MKQLQWRRAAALLLVLALLLALSLQAAALEDPAPVQTEPVETEPVETEPVETEPVQTEPVQTEPEIPDAERTDEELIEKYHIPDNWARQALLFAVRNGLMQGRGGGDLAPEANITRAELAAMVMRVLRTPTLADLSGFTDVPQGAWYHDSMAGAVAAEIYLGNGNGTLTPGGTLTREQAFTVLARMFGAAGGDPQRMYSYTDYSAVSAWAVPAVASLLEQGLIQGKGSRLDPKGSITRQELAQVFANALDRVADTLPQDAQGSYALPGQAMEPGATVEGDLLLCTDAPELELKELTVTGRLVIQGAGKLQLRLTGCQVNQLVLCRPTDLLGADRVNTVCANAFTRVFCNVPALTANANVVVFSPNRVDTLTVATDGVYLTVSGQVGSMTVRARDVGINGSGSIDKLTVERTGCRVSCSVGTRTDRIEPKLAALQISESHPGDPTVASPRVNFQYRLTSCGSKKFPATAQWYVDGSPVTGQVSFLLQEGAALSELADFSQALAAAQKTSSQVQLIVRCEGMERSVTTQVSLMDGIRQAAAKVRTQNVQARIRYSTSLYSSYNLYSGSFSGYLRGVSAGTQVTLLKSSKSTGARIRLPGGQEGWVPYGALSVYGGSYYTTSRYSQAVMEYYVNYVRGWSSNTRYLVWVNTWTQTVNIFQGSKGNWRLVRTGPCASGRNGCPTPVESTTIRYKTSRWEYASYYCHHVSVFDEARGFHSRPTAYGGGIVNWTMGQPASAGCVRLPDEDCIWIYNNVPVGSAVQIY